MDALKIICPSCQEEFVLDNTQAARILAQVRDAAFDRAVEKAVSERVESIKRDHETRLEAARSDQRAKDIDAFSHERQELDQKVSELKSELAAKTAEAELDKERAIGRAVSDAVGAISADYDKREAALREELEYYKDFKARMSTKMIGETLERHCAAEFERIRGCLPPGVYFEKDNDARTGSKGDFIYREMDSDTEVLSIMFEMKNEADSTEKKHKNEDFLRELDKDRKEKNCEYAVLVSMLEADNETYNTGIVYMGHKFPDMYVIRPQFFIPMITILRTAALKSMSAKKALEEARNRDIDVSRFSDDLDKFHSDFNYNCNQADKRLDETIDELDKAIARLQKARDGITAAQRQMRLASGKVESLTVRKLCRGNETMRAAFESVGIKI